MANLKAWISALVALILPVKASTKVTDLSTFKWNLASTPANISVPAKIPGAVHLDLQAAGIIGDPYHGLNDYDLRWVIKPNWTYSAEISKPASGASAWLLFNGLDTFTSIELCGKHVAATNNQFRQYWFDVTNIFKNCSGKPTLSINFGNAVEISEKISKIPGQETWPPGVEGLFEFEHRQFIRKEQNDFGWDWGPAFSPTGTWQPAYLVEIPPFDVHIRNVLVDVYRENQVPLLVPDQSKNWVVNASLDYLGSLPKDAHLEFALFDQKKQLVTEGKLTNVIQASNTITGSTVIAKDFVNLWWPTGLGNQTLYSLRLTIAQEGKKSISSVTRKIGFRTILLNQEPIRPDQLAKGVAPGANWHFEINGKEFYAKGSNFIPPDAFWTRVTRDKMELLFDAVVKGNQNMLRVWASGAYLPDFIYDIADELGVLLWSEFNFGDALYPVDKEFLNNCKEEAVYQVRRINHHPSLALWAGGNELENLELRQVQGSENSTRYFAEYETLFLDILGVTVFENSRSISYTPSSTSNGWSKLDFSRPQPITQRYYNTTAGEIYGDTDYYNYDSTVAFDFTRYPVGRFSNEFGFHSMPSIHTWRQAVDEKDLSWESEVVILRNHHPPPGGPEKNLNAARGGMLEMTQAHSTYYPIPNKTDPAAQFAALCLASQIFQADYYGSQIQFYRRGSGMPERQLGSLYWQLEDIWQAPTWAGIEYGGRWKVLHYRAKDLYQNVIVSPFYNLEDQKLEVYVTSDLFVPVAGKLHMEWYDWKGKPLNLTQNFPKDVNVTVGAINSTRIGSWNLSDTLNGIDLKNAVLMMETYMWLAELPPNTAPTKFYRHRNWFTPTFLSSAKIVDPGLKLTHVPKELKFVIKATSGVAAWVWLDYPADVLVTFDNNGFWVSPDLPMIVKYEVHEDNGKIPWGWADNVTVQSIWDFTLP
ncbi:glycoside hydrolase family 2 protein [Microthyrium microscopicum]|uniref:Beta-mannosidase A n=1 Tax=Microthyrium microscopicum TaxID=703497 RepID=A0A6A6TY29_9PEZI|nr:glycoside hydrolase family 2 protein [Microthyrium microscopicum]